MSDLTDRLRCFDRQTCTEAAERIEALEAELAAMRAEGEPVAEMVPCHTPSGKRVAVISRFKHLPIGTKLYTHHQPAAQDAELYQFIRNCSMEDRNKLEHYSKDALDKAIRAAIAAQQGEKT